MRSIFKPALGLAALTLAAAAAVAPTASATEKPGGTATTRTAAAGTNTALVPGLSYAWIHFLPTVASDHLSALSGDHITTLCYVWGEGNQYWDVVVDRDRNYTGFTPESYLTNTSSVPCSSAGLSTHLFQPSWIHLHPEADWEHQVANGSSIQALCSVWAYDPTDSSWRYWDVIVDLPTGMVGYTLDNYVYGSNPAVGAC